MRYLSALRPALLPGLLLAAFAARAQGLPAPVDPVVNIDYVSAAATTDPVKVRWRILNGGTAPFTATGGQSSSAALTARWRNTPIEPGEYLLVDGLFAPGQHAAGRLAEQLLLKTDAGAPLRLTVVGTVLAEGEKAPPPARLTPAPDRGITTYGYVNGMGIEAIAPSFKTANKFSNGRAAVETRQGWGYIDTKGAFVTDTKYKWAIIFREGLGVVRGANDKWGVVDLAGQEVVPCQFDALTSYYFSEGTLGVVKGGHGLLIDGYGRDLGLTADPGIQAITAMSGGVALFKKGDKWGVMNAKGKVLLPPTYDDHKGDFQNGCALVSRGKLMGFIDATGREIMPCTFTTAKPFSEGKGMGATDDGPTHVFDRAGKELFTVVTQELFEYHSGRALSYSGPGLAKTYVDAAGKTIEGFRSMYAFPYSDGYAAFGKGMTTWGFLGWQVMGFTCFDFDILGEMALYEGRFGLASARSNKSGPSLGCENVGRRQPDETVIEPAEGAAMLSATTQATLIIKEQPALAGQPLPPISELYKPDAKPEVPKAVAGKPAASKAVAKPAARPAAKPAVRK